MKQRLLFTLLAVCLLNLSFGQDREKYLELISEAQLLCDNSKFEEAGQKFSEAFIAFGNQKGRSDQK